MTRRIRNSAAVLALATGAAATSASAQAICTAPHSSPTLTESGAIRTLPASAGWLQASLYSQRSTEGFDPLGDRRAFLANSTFSVRSAFLTGAYGLTTGLEVWVQGAVHRARVDGEGGASETTGLGDVRGAVRVSPALFGYEVPVAVRAGLKLPGSDFPVDATQLPVSEGQTDYEVSVESGWSPVAYPVYVAGWIGRRWRGENAAAGFEPGDETFAHAAVGGWVGSFAWELGVDGLWGAAPVEQGLTLPSAARRLVQLLPTVGANVGPGRLELTAPIPISGKNLPAGMGLSAGYRVVWGM